MRLGLIGEREVSARFPSWDRGGIEAEGEGEGEGESEGEI